MAHQQQPQGVHLVGSIPLTTTEDVFRRVCKSLPDHVHRIPDGETGVRYNFVYWQFLLFPEETLFWGVPPGKYGPDEEVTTEDVQRVADGLPNPLNTGFDDAAIASYAVFRNLKDEGAIPKHVRFQVALPTATAVIVCLRMPYRATLEPIYQAALDRALARIQTEIPPHDLAIQIDVAPDHGIIEGLPFFLPWFSPVHEGIVDRIMLLADQVHQDVELGFHHCYGDVDHKHWMEPNDTGTMVGVAKAILARNKHPVNWIHMPVPKGRHDPEYFTPLKELAPHLGQTEFYLGLVHANDEEGTRRRIRAAQEAGVERFGVATECGMGRTPADELDSIFAISTNVSKPFT